MYTLRTLAERTDGYTGADLEDLVRRAGLQAIREDLQTSEITMRLFEAALRETRASVTPEMEREYEEIRESLKHEGPRGQRRIGFTLEAERAAAD